MCWIFAYNWNKNAIPILLDWLQSLEYRWYDSAGLISISSDKDIFFEKAIWKVSMLSTKVRSKNSEWHNYTNGIAHTRWATHGEVTLENTHPHISNNKRFYVVHNGIIENYLELKEHLKEKWYSFYGDTDSEVIANLLEEYFIENITKTVELITTKIIGAYSLAIIDKENPKVLIWAKLGSPLILGINTDEIIISSDINTVSKYASEFISLDDREIVKIENASYSIFSLGEKIEKEVEVVEGDFQIASKWKFETFTEKEIHEIPRVLENVCRWRVNFENKSITSETLDELCDMDISKIEIIASGSSYFAGQVWCSWLASLAGIEAEVRVSSEFLYGTFIPNPKTLYIFMSQSGETADVRESVKKVQEKWCHTFGIVNTVWSTISRMCEFWMYTHAGAEIWVASTKNVIAQLAVLLIVSLRLWLKKDLQSSYAREIIQSLGELPKVIEEQLQNSKETQSVINKYYDYKNFFFLWRGLLQWTAQEASLKLKELSYIHSESYSTGELKHGPLALVGENFPCFVLWATNFMYEKTISNVKEIWARKAPLIWIVYDTSKYKDIYDDIITIPFTHDVLSPFTSLIPSWVFAVWVAKKLWKDIDKPQNLAKSVTVE